MGSNNSIPRDGSIADAYKDVVVARNAEQGLALARRSRVDVETNRPPADTVAAKPVVKVDIAKLHDAQ